ncbi:cysteine-rich receptor-like protein kinase 8 [Tanacetum coccineum]
MFALINGSRKYKLNRETYDVMQSSQPISEYYTKIKCVWEELDSMNALPRITTINTEITAFLNVINTQKEEQRLFQFLNGLDEHFATQRSQLLLTLPLSNVETTCALLQQEESQREVFGSTQSLMESTALYSKTDKAIEGCCIGYPPWHYKYKQSQQQKNKGKNVAKQGSNEPKRTAAVAATESSRHIMFTSKQFEQLMKSLPHFSNHAKASNFAETDDELDNEYVTGLNNKEGSGTSRATWTYLLVQKSDSFKVLTAFCKSEETQFDRKVKVIRSNNALEFLKGSIGSYLTEQGIEHQTYCVDRPQQDGIVERKHMHFLEFLRVFGCLAMASNPDRQADKFSPRGAPCLFFGYPQHQKGYKLYNLFNNTKFVSRDVQFYEEIFPYSQPHMLRLLNPLPSQCAQNTHWYDDYVTTIAPNVTTQVHLKIKESANETAPSTNPHVSTAPATKQNASATKQTVSPQVPVPRRSSKNTTTPVWLQDYVTHHIPRANQVALELNGTWEITDLPPLKKPIDCHWIYKTKLKAGGIEDRKKAILVIIGNRQRKGVYYEETFAPVANMVTSKADYSLFIKKYNTSFTAVLVYVDDLMIIGTHSSEIHNLKSQLSSHFHMKDLGSLNYFLVLEVSRTEQGVKLGVVSRSSAEAKYRAMALTCCEVTWLVSLLKDLGIKDLGPVDLKCDDQTAIYIAANPMFHARTKHIKVDCHYVRDQVKAGNLKPSYVPSKAQEADVFTRVLSVDQHQ